MPLATYLRVENLFARRGNAPRQFGESYSSSRVARRCSSRQTPTRKPPRRYEHADAEDRKKEEAISEQMRLCKERSCRVD